jgi:hypothetical protein
MKVLPHAMNLMVFGAGEPIKKGQGKPPNAWGNETIEELERKALGDLPDPNDPARSAAAQLDRMRRGLGNTLLSSSLGPAATSRPSLLGSGGKAGVR